ncbi:MAG: hypothetical protein KIS85_07255 [Anaerolineales bacterium]|nr:hypothetical protein [Anaerolineales bacterium]
MHALLVVPIWSVTAFALVVAVPSGALVGWAFAAQERLPRNPYTAILLFSGALVLVMAVSFLVAGMQTPIAQMTFGGSRLHIRKGYELLLAARVASGVLVPAMSGAAAGWWLGRSKQAAGRMALVALLFATGAGQNVPAVAEIADITWLLISGTLVAAALSFGAVAGAIRQPHNAREVRI